MNGQLNRQTEMRLEKGYALCVLLLRSEDVDVFKAQLFVTTYVHTCILA